MLLILAVVAGAAGYLIGADDRPRPGPVTTGSPSAAIVGRVQEVSGDRLRITTESGDIESAILSPSTRVEALRPARLSELRAGDWLNVGAIPHAQTIFAITGIVVIPDAVLEATP
jgi:hypothetical protein